MLQQRVTTDRIELAKNIVDQQKRRRGFFQHENAGLRDLQGESCGALLSFRRVLIRGLSLDHDLDVIAMWADHRLAQAQFPGTRILQIARKLLAVSRRKTNLQRFVISADVAMRGRPQRSQPLH